MERLVDLRGATRVVLRRVTRLTERGRTVLLVNVRLTTRLDFRVDLRRELLRTVERRLGEMERLRTLRTDLLVEAILLGTMKLYKSNYTI